MAYKEPPTYTTKLSDYLHQAKQAREQQEKLLKRFAEKGYTIIDDTVIAPDVDDD